MHSLHMQPALHTDAQRPAMDMSERQEAAAKAGERRAATDWQVRGQLGTRQPPIAAVAATAFSGARPGEFATAGDQGASLAKPFDLLQAQAPRSLQQPPTPAEAAALHAVQQSCAAAEEQNADAIAQPSTLPHRPAGSSPLPTAEHRGSLLPVVSGLLDSLSSAKGASHQRASSQQASGQRGSNQWSSHQRGPHTLLENRHLRMAARMERCQQGSPQPLSAKAKSGRASNLRRGPPTQPGARRPLLSARLCVRRHGTQRAQPRPLSGWVRCSLRVAGLLQQAWSAA